MHFLQKVVSKGCLDALLAKILPRANDRFHALHDLLIENMLVLIIRTNSLQRLMTE